MNEFNRSITDLLALIGDINYGQMAVTPSYRAVAFHVWYAGDTRVEEDSANKLVTRLLGSDFEVVRHKDIGHTDFKGMWRGLKIEIHTANGAFCERAKVGTKTVPAMDATPATTVDVYEWVCADPILAVQA